MVNKHSNCNASYSHFVNAGIGCERTVVRVGNEWSISKGIFVEFASYKGKHMFLQDDDDEKKTFIKETEKKNEIK